MFDAAKGRKEKSIIFDAYKNVECAHYFCFGACHHNKFVSLPPQWCSSFSSNISAAVREILQLSNLHLIAAALHGCRDAEKEKEEI